MGTRFMRIADGDRRFVLEDEGREYFRMLMRMRENFEGCRVLTYCVMSNRFHVLPEVPPVSEDGAGRGAEGRE